MIGSLINRLSNWLAESVDDAGDVSGVGRPIPVSVWAGFADLSTASGRQLLTDLQRAGASRIVFTPTNDASSARWIWQPRRARLRRSIEVAKDLGFDVELGPWCRADADFMDVVGRRLRDLSDDVQGVAGWELDCEGSFEATARRHPKGIQAAVDESLAALRRHVRDEELSATVLYCRRPAGDALIKSKVANVRRVVVQAYSVWLKKPSTHVSKFQPGTLQRRAWSNYRRFKLSGDIDQLAIGLGWWAQDRSSAPPKLRLTRAEAFERATQACVELGVDGVSGWACHLFSGDSDVHRARRRLVIEQIQLLTRKGRDGSRNNQGVT
jgi:hypothetical protein